MAENPFLSIGESALNATLENAKINPDFLENDLQQTEMVLPQIIDGMSNSGGNVDAAEYVEVVSVDAAIQNYLRQLSSAADQDGEVHTLKR